VHGARPHVRRRQGIGVRPHERARGPALDVQHQGGGGRSLSARVRQPRLPRRATRLWTLRRRDRSDLRQGRRAEVARPHSSRRGQVTSSYDYVVIGGGSAGCIVAAELAKRARVLLLEGGPAAEEHPETLIASGYKDAFIND